MTLGEFLKQQRELHQWKQPEAAEKIAIEQSYLSKLENNKAIPSADIFDKLMAVYQFSIQQISEAVQGSELEKLKDIVVVREFILSTKKRKDKDKRRFLISGLIMSMIGGFLLSLGIVFEHHTSVKYHYESKGVIQENESDYAFMVMPEYHNFTVIMIRNGQELEFLKRNPLFDRLDYQQKMSDINLGEFYMQQVDGAKRRFQKIRTTKVKNKLPFYLGTSLGIMFLVGSLSIFYVSRRW